MSMNPPGPPEGPISPDGLYRWDGQQWVPRTTTPPAAPPSAAAPAPGAQYPAQYGNQWQAPPSSGSNSMIFAAVAGVIVVVVLGLVALTVFGKQTTTPPVARAPVISQPPLTTPVASADSGAYTPPDGLWSASFPGTPQYTSTTVPGATGETIPYAYSEYSSRAHDEFVGVLTLPPGSTFSLKAGIDGIVTKSGGTLVSSGATTFQGLSSFDGTIAVSSQFIACRAVRSGNYVYVFGSVGDVNPPPDFATLAASVKLTPH